MTRYILGRILLIVPTLLALAFIIFTVAALAPGDPAEEYARRTSPTGEATPAAIARARVTLGLDRPFVVRYVTWVAGAVHGDLGRSFSRQTRVASDIAQRWAATAELAVAALVVTAVVAVPLGVVAAMNHGTWIDHQLRVVNLLVASIPGFFLAYLLIIGFAVRLQILPVAGREGIASIVLPTVTLAAPATATVSRLLRASLLEVLSEDYVRTARAKGLSRLQVMLRHALPSAAIPVITVLGGLLGYLLAGAIIVEFIFAWPGLGLLLSQAVSERDYPTIEGLVVVAGGVFLILNLLVDLSYMALDPRLRLARR